MTLKTVLFLRAAYVCEMPGDDMTKRRAIINIFVHSVYLYDDHLTLIINASNKPVAIDDIPLDDIETDFNGEKSAMEQCSNTSDIVPPPKYNLGNTAETPWNIEVSDFFIPQCTLKMSAFFIFTAVLSL